MINKDKAVLTDEQILKLFNDHDNVSWGLNTLAFGRAIEAAVLASADNPSTAGSGDEHALFEGWAQGRVTSLIKGKFGTGYVYADAARAWDAWQARAALAAPVAQSTAGAAKGAPESMANSNARFAIDGAIQYGRENRNQPPSTDHWLYEYWNIGRQLNEAGRTGWDNVTPLAAPAVQAPMPQWISVDEREPDEDTHVIILYWPYDNHENKQVAGMAHYYDGCFYAVDWNPHHPPSHWMPMPPIPSAASKEGVEKAEPALEEIMARAGAARKPLNDAIDAFNGQSSALGEKGGDGA